MQAIASGQDYGTEPSVANQLDDDPRASPADDTAPADDPKGPRNFECRHQRERALGGNPTSGASLDPLTFATEITFGASSDRSPYLSQYQNGLTCYGVEKKQNTT